MALAATWLALATPAAAEAQQEPKQPPTQLWEEYPLDLTQAEEPEQADAPQPTTAERPVTPAAQAPSPTAQEERSSLWRMLPITIGLAALAGILAALIVIGLSNVLARGRGRWRLTRARGSAPKRARTPRRLFDEELRSEARSLVPSAERSQGGTPGRHSRPLAAPRKAAPAPKEAAPPPLRTLPKKLPTAGAPPPKKWLPGLSPPKKDGLVPAGLPPGKALGPGPPPGKALSR